MSFKDDGDAIVAWLAAGSWSESLNEERKNVVYWQSDATSTLATYVVPLSAQPRPGTRYKPAILKQYGIFLLQSLSETTEAAELTRQDELMALVDSIEDALFQLDTMNNFPLLIDEERRIPLDVEAANSQVFLAGVRLVINRL